MRKNYTTALFILFLTLFPILQAGAYENFRTEPHPFWTEASSWPDTLTVDMIITASLKASGVSAGDLERYTNRLEEIVREISDEPVFKDTAIDTYRKGELLLEWIHENLLTGYSYHQTMIDVLLDTGINNCVSSSIIYLLLGKVLDLDITAIETKDHVFCVAETEKGPVDVETTTIYGFDPGIKKEFADEFDRTGYTYVPPGNYRRRTPTTDKELIGLIFQNRMAGLQREGKHHDVYEIAVDQHAFLNNERTLENLNSAFKNRAAELSNLNRNEEAFSFLIEMSQQYGLEEENGKVLYQLAHNVIVLMLNNEEHQNARNFLGGNETHIPSDNLPALRKLIESSAVEHAVFSGIYEEAIPLLRSGLAEGNITLSRWRELTGFLHRKKAVEIYESTGYTEAIRFIGELPENEQNLTTVKRIRSTFLQNWTAVTHNSFVDLVNAGNNQEARKVIEEGLEIDPENRTFIRDLSDLEKIENQ